MNELTPETTFLLLSTTSVGVLMMKAGVEKKMLEWRRDERTCARCGKLSRRPVCTCAA